MIIHLKKMLAGHMLRQGSAVNAPSIIRPVEATACPEFIEGPSPMAWISGDWKNLIKLMMLALCAMSTAPSHAMKSVASAPRVAIIKAALNGDFQKVEKLIKKDKSCVSQVGAGNWTALMSAASMGHVAICKLLLNNGADINARCLEECCSALTLAAQNGHKETCELLTDAGANVAFLWPDAVLTQNAIVIRNLIQSGIDVNMPVGSQNETALFRAAQDGDENLVVTLLLNKADVNKPRTHGFTPLMIAAQRGHTKIVQLLLQRGARINASAPRKLNNKTALYLAVERGNSDVVKLLLSHKDIDIHGGCLAGIATLCQMALRSGHMDTYRLLSDAWEIFDKNIDN